MFIEQPALVAQADAARAPVQQAHAQSRLQPGDALAHGRARQAQAFGGQREIAGVGHAHEGPQIADVVDAGQGLIVHGLSPVFGNSDTLSAHWNQ